RSSILEDITGTDIYSIISMKVFEKERKEGESLKLLQAGVDGIELLPKEEVDAFTEELQRLQKENDRIATEKKKIDELIQRVILDKKFASELVFAEEQTKNATRQLAEFAPQKKKLTRALKAAECDGEYATLDAVRKQQKNDEKTLTIDKGKAPQLQKNVEITQKVAEQSEGAVTVAKKVLEKEREIIKKVREVDVKINEKKTVLKAQEEKIHNIKHDKKTREKRAEEYKKADQRLKVLEDAVALLEKQRKELLNGKELREYRTQYEHLVEKQLLQKKITDLKDERDRLQDGEQCPLCGSTEHPYSKGVSVGLDAVKEEIKQVKKTIDATEAFDDQIKRKTKDVDGQRGIVESLKKKVDDDSRQQDDVEKLQTELGVITKNYKELLVERKSLYGDKNPDSVESRLKKSLSDAERGEKGAQSKHTAAELAHKTVESAIKTLEKTILERSTKLADLQKSWEATLIRLEFSDETEFLSQRLPSETRERLQKEEMRLKTQLTAAETKKTTIEKQLQELRKQKMPEKPLEELQIKTNELSGLLRTVQENRGSINQRLKANSDALEKIKEKKEAIDRQKKEYEKWSRLSQLIGAATGNTYRNFAQGLTFEVMVIYANEQLSLMSDRYLLVRDIENPLELNVVDDYQAGEIRSTKNLSGGESFLVSLSLALGLSKMSSAKVSVDSLFLDEGFGTLDEESLETALNTLAGLQQSGKLIGVISHVAALKERIGTQIVVEPLTGGKSSVMGPGVSCEDKKE
ncbi:hypothetical protein KAH37_05630, partial [bacterium]|nr:hypothetical protein [bacterium]